MNPFPTRLPRSTRDRWSNRLLRTLLTLAVVIAGLVAPTAPARGQTRTPTVTFMCGRPRRFRAMHGTRGGHHRHQRNELRLRVSVDDRPDQRCHWCAHRAWPGDPRTGALWRRLVRTSSRCRQSVTAGQYRVRAYQSVPSEAVRTWPTAVTADGRRSDRFRVAGIARCDDREPLREARVDLFSGASLVDSTTTDRVTGAFSFNVAPGAYTVRYTKGPIVCGGPTDAEGDPQPENLLDLNNESWPSAFEMPLAGTTTQTAFAVQHLWKQDMSAWYRFRVQPGARVIVTLTGGEAGDGPLPVNYDLTLYKDIAAAFKELTIHRRIWSSSRPSRRPTPSRRMRSRRRLHARRVHAGCLHADAFTPDAFTPDAFSPDAFTPDAFTPDAFTPDAFTPDAFTPMHLRPMPLRRMRSPPMPFRPMRLRMARVSPEAFASAQTRSLIAVPPSMAPSGEGVARNTWDNNTDFYVRVRGRNGAFSLAAPFHLDVTIMAGARARGRADHQWHGTLRGRRWLQDPRPDRPWPSGGYRRGKVELAGQLQEFLRSPEVRGTVRELRAGDARIAAARTQSDAHNECPFAKNVLAGEIKRLIDSYRALNPGLEYIVFIGNDDVVPFFREPDQAGLANEKIVRAAGARHDGLAGQPQARLRPDAGHVWGAAQRLAPDHTLPVPDLAVGRLIETAVDATGMLDAYLDITEWRVVATPEPALVTGYDFLADAATAIGRDPRRPARRDQRSTR